MKALEFETKIEDGVIRVPKKYHKDLKKKFRIIILVKEVKSTSKRKSSLKNKFKSIKLDTKGFKFDRDEAHER